MDLIYNDILKFKIVIWWQKRNGLNFVFLEIKLTCIIINVILIGSMDCYGVSFYQISKGLDWCNKMILLLLFWFIILYISALIIQCHDDHSTTSYIDTEDDYSTTGATTVSFNRKYLKTNYR